MTNNQLQKIMAKAHTLEEAIESTIKALDYLLLALEKPKPPESRSNASIRRGAAIVHLHLDLLTHYPNLNYSAEYRKIAKDTKKSYKKNTDK